MRRSFILCGYHFYQYLCHLYRTRAICWNESIQKYFRLTQGLFGRVGDVSAVDISGRRTVFSGGLARTFGLHRIHGLVRGSIRSLLMPLSQAHCIDGGNRTFRDPTGLPLRFLRFSARTTIHLSFVLCSVGFVPLRHGGEIHQDPRPRSLRNSLTALEANPQYKRYSWPNCSWLERWASCRSLRRLKSC